MNDDNLIAFQSPESPTLFNDGLTELVRQGARQIIAQAVEAELQEFLTPYQSLKDEPGRQAIVRNGHLPERTIVTGVGAVAVQVPKVRDRTQSGIKFNSSLLPPYLKRSPSVEEGLPLAVPQRRFDRRLCRSFECLTWGLCQGDYQPVRSLA